jgi:hypothetical protein
MPGVKISRRRLTRGTEVRLSWPARMVRPNGYEQEEMEAKTDLGVVVLAVSIE